MKTTPQNQNQTSRPLVLLRVVFQALRFALTGVACEAGVPLALTGFIRSFLFGVAPWDPFAFVAIPVMLIGITVAAAWLPATRAIRVDPMDVLRHD